jgi:hypothetical protein
MRVILPRRDSFALVLAVTFCQFTPGLHAQNQTQDPSSLRQEV